jgi:chlorite dismutase
VLKHGEMDGAPGIFVVIAAFKLSPEWQMLEGRAQRVKVEQAAQLVRRSARDAAIDIYISRGLRAHCDYFLRVRARQLEDAQRIVQNFCATALGRLSLATETLVGVTKPRQYINQERSPELTTKLNAAKYQAAEPQFAIVIPVKKNAHWWNLAETERRREVETHTRKALPYLDRVKRELYHSTGLDDLDFITYFETADLRAFQELCSELMAIPENEYHTRWGQPVLLGTIQPLDDGFSPLIRKEQFEKTKLHKETRKL